MKYIYFLLVLFVLTGCSQTSPAKFTYGDHVAVYNEKHNYLRTGIIIEHHYNNHYLIMDRLGVRHFYPQHSLMLVNRPNWDVKILNRRGGFFYYEEDGDKPDYTFR